MQDVSPELVRELTIEEAARVVQRSILGPGPTTKAKKAAKKTAYVLKAKKAKKAVARKAVSSAHVVRPNYWKRVKNELHVLICTNDARYAAPRKHLGKESKTTQVAIVTSIAGTIGAYIGVAAAIVGRSSRSG